VPFSPYAKRQVGLDMYVRAKNFIAAAVLLKREQGSPFVIRHLLCQGIELLLKAILLMVDYDKYFPELRKIGHDLLKASKKVQEATGIDFVSASLKDEMQGLSQFFKLHMLRYASTLGLLTGADTLPMGKTLGRTAAALRVVERELRHFAASS
jgi:hypothetical protein